MHNMSPKDIQIQRLEHAMRIVERTVTPLININTKAAQDAQHICEHLESLIYKLSRTENTIRIWP